MGLRVVCSNEVVTHAFGNRPCPRSECAARNVIGRMDAAKAGKVDGNPVRYVRHEQVVKTVLRNRYARWRGELEIGLVLVSQEIVEPRETSDSRHAPFAYPDLACSIVHENPERV